MADPLSVTVGVIGITTFALQSIRSLVDAIDSIRNAPDAVANLSGDLKTIAAIVGNLHEKLTSHALEPALEKSVNENGSLISAIRSCADDCARFKDVVTTWTKHSSPERIAWQDRVKVGLFGEKKIQNFARRLAQSGATVNLALTSAIFLNTCQTREMTEELKTLVVAKREELAAYGQVADQEINRVEAQMTGLAVNNAAAATGSANSSDPHDSTAEDFVELRQELQILRNQKDISADALNKMPGEQQISNINMDDNSRIMAGFINVDSQGSIKQNISQVSATKGSRGIVGVAKSVKMDNFWD